MQAAKRACVPCVRLTFAKEAPVRGATRFYSEIALNEKNDAPATAPPPAPVVEKAAPATDAAARAANKLAAKYPPRKPPVPLPRFTAKKASPTAQAKKTPAQPFKPVPASTRQAEPAAPATTPTESPPSKQPTKAAPVTESLPLKQPTRAAPVSDSNPPSRPILHTLPPRVNWGQPDLTDALQRTPAAAPQEVGNPLDIDWSKSYYGIGSQAVTEAQYAQLVAPLDPRDIEIKSDGVIYLPEIKYRRRLFQAFGPMGWGLIPRGQVVVGKNIVTREYALIAHGRFVAQAQGENNFFSDEQLPSAVEGCKSNALMRCCKDLGIASELWDPAYVRWYMKTWAVEQWVEHIPSSKKRKMMFKRDNVEVAYPLKLC